MQAPKNSPARPIFYLSQIESTRRTTPSPWAEWVRKSARQDLSQDLKELQEARKRFQFLIEEVNDILARN